MPTRTDRKSGTARLVPGEPVSFHPQVRADASPNAWDSLQNLSSPQRAAGLTDQEALAALARLTIRRRAARTKFLPAGMFGEPGWDMLLSLYVAWPNEARHTVSSMVAASQTSATSALRWLDYLDREKLIERRSNPIDKRVVFIEMTDLGRNKVEAFFKDQAVNMMSGSE